jgi:hypothetical protein
MIFIEGLGFALPTGFDRARKSRSLTTLGINHSFSRMTLRLR